MKKGTCISCGKECDIYEDTEHCLGCDMMRQDVEQGFDDGFDDLFTKSECFNQEY